MNLIDSSYQETSTTLPAPPPADVATIALFVDIDGTLIDFATHPDAVIVDETVRASLRTINALLGGALAPVSGRPLRRIDELLQLPPGAAAGLHGAELRLADGSMIEASTDATRLDGARLRALHAAEAHAGVLIEDKRGAIALHYRAVPQAANAVHEAAAEMLTLAAPGYELLQGDMVMELKPMNANKGIAVATLMRTAPFLGRTPWMIGDDRTDEDAFDEVDALGGISVIVGTRRPTRARYALASPASVRAWLAGLAERGSAA